MKIIVIALAFLLLFPTFSYAQNTPQEVEQRLCELNLFVLSSEYFVVGYIEKLNIAYDKHQAKQALNAEERALLAIFNGKTGQEAYLLIASDILTKFRASDPGRDHYQIVNWLGFTKKDGKFVLEFPRYCLPVLGKFKFEAPTEAELEHKILATYLYVRSEQAK